MPTSVDLARLQQLRARGAQLVEVLPPAEYVSEHLPSSNSSASARSTTTPPARPTGSPTVWTPRASRPGSRALPTPCAAMP
jgi:hypothetical protein